MAHILLMLSSVVQLEPRQTSEMKSDGIAVPRFAVLLGISAMLIAGGTGYLAARATRHAIRGTVIQSHLNVARAIAQSAEALPPSSSEADVLAAIDQMWQRITHPPGNAYVCVIQSDGVSLLHTLRSKAVGTNVGHLVIRTGRKDGPKTLRDLVSAGEDWVGDFTAMTGESQVAACAYVPRLASMVIIHTPSTEIEALVQAHLLPGAIGLTLAIVVLIPMSLGLLYRAHSSSMRQRDLAAVALRESRIRLQGILDHAPAVIYMVDTDNQILLVNRRWETLFHRTSAEVVGKSLFEVFDTETAQRLAETNRRAMGETVSVDTEEVVPHEEGRHTYLSLTFPLLAPDGKPYALCGISTDITDRKKAEQSLRNLALSLATAEQTVRRDVANVLHDDVQQLLTAAKLAVEVLPSQDPNQLEESVANARDLIAQALDTTLTLTSRLTPPILREGRLDLAFDWLADWMATHHGLTVEVRCKATPDLPVDVMEFLFTSTRELLFNVVKHAGVGQAQLSMTCEAETLEIRVSDEGSGFQVETHVHRRTSGGLGLVELRERLEAMGGKLMIDSEPGRGGQVKIVLPISLSKKESAASTPPLSQPVREARAALSKREERRIRVLIVDDHELMRKGLLQLFSVQDGIFVVGEAKDGREAYERAGTLQPNAILMDINMPVMNGVESTRRIKRAYTAIQVIGLSMHDDAAVKAEFMSAGGSAYVTKGADAKVLVELIERFCSKASLPRPANA